MPRSTAARGVAVLVIARECRGLLLLAGLGFVGAGCARATDEWIRDLADSEPFSRSIAVVALRDADRAAVPRVARLVLERVIDPDAAVAADARATLAVLGRRWPEVLLELWRDPRTAAGQRDTLAAAFVEAGSTAIEPVVAALADPSCPARVLLARSVGRMGEQALAAVARLGSSRELETRVLALSALQIGGDTAAITPIARSIAAEFRSPSTEVRAAAHAALVGSCRESEAAAWSVVGDLDAYASDERRRIVDAVVRGLLRPSSNSPARLESAALVLGALGDAALAPLVDSLRDPSLEVRSWAEVALAATGPSALVVALAADLEPANVSAVAARMGTTALPAIHSSLGSGDPAEQLRAVRCAGDLGAAAQPLAPRLRELEARGGPLGEAAARALAAIEGAGQRRK